MKAIELMQKLGELVVAHGDIEVVIIENRDDPWNFNFAQSVTHRVIESSQSQDMHFIEIASNK